MTSNDARMREIEAYEKPLRDVLGQLGHSDEVVGVFLRTLASSRECDYALAIIKQWRGHAAPKASSFNVSGSRARLIAKDVRRLLNSPSTQVASAGSRLLTEQDAERRWKKARALVEDFAERGELEDALYEFAGEADALAAALVARDAELAEALGEVEKWKRYHREDMADMSRARDDEHVKYKAEVAAPEAEVTRLRAAIEAAQRENSHQTAIVGDVREILRRWSQRGSSAEDTLYAIAHGVGYYLAAGVVPPEQATDDAREALNQEATVGPLLAPRNEETPGREPEDTQATKGQVT